MDEKSVAVLIKEFLIENSRTLNLSEVVELVNESRNSGFYWTVDECASLLAQKTGDKKTFSHLIERIRDNASLHEFLNVLFSMMFPDPYASRNEEYDIFDQEKKVIEDLFNVFVGGEGYFIKDAKIDDSLCPHLRPPVEKLLPIADYNMKITKFARQNMDNECGRVNQSLAYHLLSHSTLFSKVVFEQEKLLYSEGLRLTDLWLNLSESLEILKILIDIVDSVGEYRGGLTLSALHEGTKNSLADEKSRKIWNEAASVASVPFFESISKWIYEGEILDPFDEFMIQRSQKRCHLDDWEEVFTFANVTPTFLLSVEDEILLSGKYHDAAKRCGVEFDFPILDLKYDFFDTEYIEKIITSCDLVRINFFNLIFEEYQTYERLKTAKVLFCLEYGDFYHNIIENCYSELKKPVGEINPVQLSRWSFETSCVRGLKFVNETEFYLEKETVLEQISLSRGKKDILGVDSLTLKVETEWPVSIVLHKTSIKYYQNLFRHLFKVNTVYMKLTKNVQFKILNDGEMYVRFCMIVFVSTCLYYMTQTIDVHWTSFSSGIKEMNDVDKLRKIHDNYEYLCMESCLLTSTDHYKRLTVVFEICENFSERPDAAVRQEFISALEDFVENLMNEMNPRLRNFGSMLNPIFKEGNGFPIIYNIKN